jgi:hypothetical protein
MSIPIPLPPGRFEEVFLNRSPREKKTVSSEPVKLPLPERERRIDDRLLTLRGDFDRLTFDFWRGFARDLGCEDPERAIAAQKVWMRSNAYLVIIGVIVLVGLFSTDFCFSQGNTLAASIICVIGSSAL